MAFAFFFWTPLVPAMCIENAETGKLLGTLGLTADEPLHFTIQFTHSVNRTPVRETYIATPEQLLLTRAEYVSFGAGMPEVPEQAGSTLTIQDGVMTLDNINQSFPEVIYRIGTIANHTLLLDDRAIPLVSLAPPQTALRFVLRDVTVFVFLRRLN